MVEPFVPFLNEYSLDVYPSFRIFQPPKNDNVAFKIDNKDLEETKKNIPTNSVEKTNEPEQNNVTPAPIEKIKSNSSIQCEICLITVASQIHYDNHIKGKRHRKQLAALLPKNSQDNTLPYQELHSKLQETFIMNNQCEKSEVSSSELTVNKNDTIPPSIPFKKVICKVCNIFCDTQKAFNDHMNGRKHRTNVKFISVFNSASSGNGSDNNPSSPNYCDLCLLKFDSEDALYKHLTSKEHRNQLKREKICDNMAAKMNINFDDYKIPPNTQKGRFYYRCIPCHKNFRYKMQLIIHLQDPLHVQVAIQSKNQNLSQRSDYANHKARQANSIRDDNVAVRITRPTFYKLKKPVEKSLTYQPRHADRNQRSQSFNQQTSNNIFGAFDPKNETTFSSNNNYRSPTKPSTQYKENPNEYDGFYPKHSPTYNDKTDNLQDFHSIEGNYYPSDSNNQSYWHYQSQPCYYNQQQYSNPEYYYMNSTFYPSNQPPLSYDQPTSLPNPSSPSSYNPYSQYSAFFGDTKNQNSFYY